MKKIIVLPAYNAARTLKETVDSLPAGTFDEVLLVDDCSSDGTYELALQLGLKAVKHPRNRGYGGNQKTCYSLALEHGADIVVMLHPDYQYAPQLIPAMAEKIARGECEVVLGSRILGGGALAGGMPLYKYIANRLLTLGQNLCLGARLSEYHTGYRAWHRRVLATLPLLENSDDFVFDNQILAQTLHFGFRIGEIACPCRYNPDCSSINAVRSAKYGLGVLGVTARAVLQRLGLARFPLFDPAGRGLAPESAPGCGA